MTDLDQYLEGLRRRVCTDLAQMYPSQQQPSEYGLVFPSKRDGTLGISDQEAKLRFVQECSELVAVAEVDNSYQEIYSRARLREMVMSYWNDSDPGAIRRAVVDQDIWGRASLSQAD